LLAGAEEGSRPAGIQVAAGREGERAVSRLRAARWPRRERERRWLSRRRVMCASSLRSRPFA